MKKIVLILLFCLVQIFSKAQNPRKLLIDVLESYQSLKSISIDFTYSSKDVNNDLYYLKTKGEILFTKYKSKSFQNIGGINLNLTYHSKFVNNQAFQITADMESTKIVDYYNSNGKNFREMENQLYYTRFKAHQIIPLVFLNDSSENFNRRYLLKVLKEIKLDSLDSLLSEVVLDTNYNEKRLKFTITFNNFNYKNAIKKWGKFYNKKFIEEWKNKSFIFICVRENFLPVDYFIREDSMDIITNKDIKVEINKSNIHENFSNIIYKPFPRKFLSVSMRFGKIKVGEAVEYDNFIDEIQAEYYKQNKLFNSKNLTSKYVIFYVWNSTAIDTTAEFKEICDFAFSNPDKLTIIGVNNINESDEYIDKIYKKTKWVFPTIKGKEFCRKYFISEPPVYFFLTRIGDRYCISMTYLNNRTDYLLYVLNKNKDL